MPVAQIAPPTAGSNLLASRTLGAIPQLNQQRIGLTMTRLADIVNERNQLLQSLARLREDKKAKGAERDADRAALGGQIGGAVAPAAAPFTGGASLALLPAAVSAGTGIGQLAAGDPGGAATLSNAVVANSFSSAFGNKNPATSTTPSLFGDGGGGGVKDDFLFRSN